MSHGVRSMQNQTASVRLCDVSVYRRFHPLMIQLEANQGGRVKDWNAPMYTAMVAGLGLVWKYNSITLPGSHGNAVRCGVVEFGRDRRVGEAGSTKVGQAEVHASRSVG